MKNNLMESKNIMLLANQKLHQSSGDFDQKQNEQPIINSRVKPYSASKITKESINFRYINPSATSRPSQIPPVTYYSTPKPVNLKQSNLIAQSKLEHVTNEQIIKGESSIKYVPYQRKVVQYENRSFVQKVPVKRKVVKYEEKRVTETVPREVVQQNYYAVETRVQYIKEVIAQKKIEKVPIEKKIKRYEYLPVERQIIHYPSNDQLTVTQQQTVNIVQNGPVQVVTVNNEFQSFNPNIIYTYSTRRGVRDSHLGRLQHVQSRLISQNVIPPSPKITRLDQPHLDRNDNEFAVNVQQQTIVETNFKQVVQNQQEIKEESQTELSIKNQLSVQPINKFKDVNHKIEKLKQNTSVQAAKKQLVAEKQVQASIIVQEDEKAR